MPRFNFKSPPPNPLNATPTASGISPPQSQPAAKLSNSVASSYIVARHVEKAKYPNPLPLLNILPSSILNQMKASVQISLRSGISQDFLRQKMQQAMGKQMNILQVYAVRNLFSAPHTQDARFWDFLTSDARTSRAFVDVSSDTKFSKESVEALDEELENLYKRYVKARLTLAGNRHRMAKINERLFGHFFSRDEDTPLESPKQNTKGSQKRHLEDDEEYRLPVEEKVKPSPNAKRPRKRHVKDDGEYRPPVKEKVKPSPKAKRPNAKRARKRPVKDDEEYRPEDDAEDCPEDDEGYCLEDDEAYRPPLGEKETPSLNVPRRRKRTKITKASSNQHMTPSQLTLARKVAALIRSNSLEARCQKIETLALDLKISRYRLEKFLEGDQLKLINVKIHKETEIMLEQWLIQRDAVL